MAQVYHFGECCRTLADAQGIKKILKNDIIVIGGGPAGVEAAIALVEVQVNPWRGSGFPVV